MNKLLTALAATLLTASPVVALEGGMTSAGDQWSRKITHGQPDATVRDRELAERKKAIQADIERLQARLERVPSEEKMDELHAQLKAVIKNGGYSEELGLVMGLRDIKPMLNGQDKTPEGMVGAFVQLKNDLAKRNIDLIVVPLVPTPLFGSHELVDGIDAEHEYYPGWTKMMLELLEADIEVIDTVDEFRHHAKDEMLVSWPNDFHTGSRGRQLAAKALAERMQRYGFVREWSDNRELWKENVREQKSTKTRIGVVNSREDKSINADQVSAKTKGRTFKVIQFDRPRGVDLRRSEVVLIGDSQLHSAVYGSGWPTFVNRELGGIFRWGSRSWGNFAPPEIYRDVVPDWAVQPRVVVLTCMTKYWWKPGYHVPRPLPELGAKDELGIPVAPFYATVEITAVSQRPTDDPKSLEYANALFHASAKVVDGPMKGQEIGLRYLAMYKHKFSRGPEVAKVGAKMELRLRNWDEYIQTNRGRGHAQWQIFDTVDQDLAVPFFWVEDGPLSWRRIRVR